MEDKRPGQKPMAEQRTASDLADIDVAGASTPGAPTERERTLIREAQAKAEADRKELRERGFGDHQGTEGS